MTKPLEQIRITRLFKVVNGSTPQSSVAEYWDGDIPWVTPEDVGKLRSSDIQSTRRYITEDGYRSCGTTLAPKDSIVLTTRAPIGNIGIAKVALCSNQGCKILIPNEKLVPKFGFYSLLAKVPLLQSLGQGSTFKELSSDSLKHASLPVPSVQTQKTIVFFLDKETSRIDALISKKERQIELLQEKRQAIISHAVTKGLDPNAKMKDSGVEWIGLTPTHWRINRAKTVFHEVDDRSSTGDEELLTVSHLTGVSRRSEKEVNMFMAESLEGYKRTLPNDLVINTMWAWMGALGISAEAGIVFLARPSFHSLPRMFATSRQRLMPGADTRRAA